VLFDLDGTLIDSAPDLGAAADKMRTDRGLASYPLERYRPMAGAGARGMLGVAFGITPESPEFDELREEFFVTYERRMLLNTQVFDGVQALIEALREQGLLWGVVTNKSMRFTDPLTRAIPLFETAAATPRRSPSRIPSRCMRPHAGSACRQKPACTWVTTSATSSRAAQRACVRLPRPTATWVRRQIRPSGRPTHQYLRPWSS
jgi:hypothetical protein